MNHTICQDVLAFRSSVMYSRTLCAPICNVPPQLGCGGTVLSSNRSLKLAEKAGNIQITQPAFRDIDHIECMPHSFTNLKPGIGIYVTRYANYDMIMPNVYALFIDLVLFVIQFQKALILPKNQGEL